MESAIAKAIALLEAVAQSKGPVRLSAMATELGMGKSTVHRILGELTELGYVAQDETTGLYRSTLRIWEIGTAVIADLPIKQVASSALHRLHEQTGETVSLTTRSGDDALYLDKIISPRPVRFTTRVGSRVPLPLTASGKALLAHADDAPEVVARVALLPLYADRLDPERALADIDKTKARGYSVSSARPGVISIAAPVRDRDDAPVAALSVSAPTDRVPRERRSEIAELVVSTANQLAESLGRL